MFNHQTSTGKLVQVTFQPNREAQGPLSVHLRILTGAAYSCTTSPAKRTPLSHGTKTATKMSVPGSKVPKRMAGMLLDPGAMKDTYSKEKCTGNPHIIRQV